MEKYVRTQRKSRPLFSDGNISQAIVSIRKKEVTISDKEKKGTKKENKLCNTILKHLSAGKSPVSCKEIQSSNFSGSPAAQKCYVCVLIRRDS